MTELRTRPSPAALEPLRSGLLRRAREDADQRIAQATEQAQSVLARARTRAAERLADAEAQGNADAAAALAADRLAARRSARSVVLAGRRALYQELRAQVIAEVRACADDPAVAARLTQRVRTRLGADAEVLAAPGGGVLGRVPGRAVDYSLDACVERVVDELGERLETLWTA